MRQKIVSNWGYHTYCNLPPKMGKVNKRTNKEYKKWREIQSKLLTEKVISILYELWWKSKNIKKRKELLKRYGDEKTIKFRWIKWSHPKGLISSTTNVKVIESMLKNSVI